MEAGGKEQLLKKKIRGIFTDLLVEYFKFFQKRNDNEKCWDVCFFFFVL